MKSFSQLALWKTSCSTSNQNRRFSYDQIPDLTGKVAIVTGANSGLGYATMVALAGRGAHVFLACRSQNRALAAIDSALLEIRSKYPLRTTAPMLEFLELNLMSLHKARESAREFLEKGLPLHVLVCNSGIMVVPFELSPDGIESQFAVNHMGHFVFTVTLLDRLKASQPSRIVMISSMAHKSFAPRAGIDFETLNDPTKTTEVTRYGRSKLANVLFTKALARRLSSEQVYINACHPGVVATSLVRQEGTTFTEWIGAMVMRAVGSTAEKGALSQLYLATSPEVEEQDLRGRYFVPVAKEAKPASLARNEELQEKLWTFSEELVREKVKA
ncbi:hypothetical protein BGX30_001301 [Mortierella sp. GBA39]|nr:hypothetical protein BGX30_001301 [Mortierella sp. GBA39]